MASLLYDNPRLLLMTIALIVVAGLSSVAVLPRMEDPTLTQRAAIVTSRFPGATPERIESLVVDVLEEELKEVPEIKEVRSTSRSGIASISIELRDDVYAAEEVWSRVRDKLSDTHPLLPPGAAEPEFDLLEVTAYASIVALRWDAEGPPSYAVLRRLAEELEQRLLAIPGTREVDTFGDPAEEITVEVDRALLASLGLTAGDVAGQLAASDAKVAAGQMRGDEVSMLMEVDTELDTLRRIEATPIRYGGSGGESRVTPLGSVATVRKGVTDPPRRLALVDGRPAIATAALVRSDQRIDAWADLAAVAIDRFERELPPAVGLKRVFEQSTYVRGRLVVLLGNLLVGSAAVVVVVGLMMGWRNALVVGSALPLASLMVLAAMRWLGVPIHQMSVTGLIIALGLLIDNAIVITDEVSLRVADGVGRREAVASAVRHLAAPLFGSTVTTCLSFAPIALMPGPAGEFVGSIAISVMLAVAASFLLAMSVTPTVAAIFGRQAGHRRAGWTVAGFSSSRLSGAYASVLGALLRRPVLAIALSLAPPVAGFYLATTLDEQFFPPAERNQFQVQLDLPAGASIEATKRLAERARATLLENPRVQSVDWFLGESAPSFYYNMLANRAGVPQYAQAIVQIDTAENYFEVVRAAQRALDERLPAGRFLVRQLEQGPPFDAPIEVRLFGPDLEELDRLGRAVRLTLSQTPGIVHTQADLSETLPKLAVSVDEESARLAGLDNRSVAAQLDATLEGAVGGSVLEATESLPVRVRVAGDERGELSRVAAIDLVAPDASRTPLEAIASVSVEPQRSAIPRFNAQRVNEVKAYIESGSLASETQRRFRERLEESGFTLPPGYRLEYAGEGAKRDDAIGNLMSSVAVLGTLMAATLVLSMGSFRLAAIIGSVAALSLGLSLGSLGLAGYPFGFTAIIGAMGLVGVAINDSIVVLAALSEDPAARRGDRSAILSVLMRSTRHVLATTFTTVVGFLPLVLGGGGFWPPMAISIAGGVLGATGLALVFVPTAFRLTLGRVRAGESADESLAVEESLEAEPTPLLSVG